MGALYKHATVFVIVDGPYDLLGKKVWFLGHKSINYFYIIKGDRTYAIKVRVFKRITFDTSLDTDEAKRTVEMLIKEEDTPFKV